MNNRFAFLEMQVSNDLLDDPAALRARLAADGYLYFRQVLDRERIAEVGKAMARATRKLGWTEPGLKPGTDVCIVTPLRESDERVRRGLPGDPAAPDLPRAWPTIAVLLGDHAQGAG